MKKRWTALLILAAMALSLCGCGALGAREPEVITNAGEPAQSGPQPEETAAPEGEGTVISDGEPAGTAAAEGNSAGETGGNFSFADLKGLEFSFSSGAGGWRTWLVIQADGSFSGQFSDSDMGSSGEGYYSAIYQSDFTGQFTQPMRVNDYTYSMQILELNYGEKFGTEEIVDGVLYCYGDAYGLTGAKDILLYLPGAPLAELPEEFRSWIGYYDLSYKEETELPFYALNNEAQQQGFSSYNVVERMREYVASAEERDAELLNTLYNDTNANQADMNGAAWLRYELWDEALNTLWRQLRRSLDKETMTQLVAEEREWINRKEQTMADAEAEGGGGSITATLVYGEGAKMTRDRVYELLELLN